MKTTLWGWMPPSFELIGEDTVRIAIDFTAKQVDEGGRTTTVWICYTEDVVDKELFRELQESPLSLCASKKLLRAKISAYDKSSRVNSFTLSGTEMWVDKATRVGLRARFGAELRAGKSYTTLWYDGKEIEVPLVTDVTAIEILDAIEIYAAKCHDITQKHLRNVDELTTIEECMAYNYKEGYPEKLVL